jgi:hypothetical protein
MAAKPWSHVSAMPLALHRILSIPPQPIALFDLKASEFGTMMNQFRSNMDNKMMSVPVGLSYNDSDDWVGSS